MELTTSVIAALDAFGEAALRRVREQLELERPATIRDVTLVFPDAGRPEFVVREGINWRVVVHHAWAALRELPELNAFGEVLFTENVYHGEFPLQTTVIGDDGQPRAVDVARPPYSIAKDSFDTNLYGLLVEYLKAEQSADFDRDRWHAAFEPYVAMWGLSNTRQLLTLPLIQFATDTPSVDLGDGFAIEPLRGDLKTLVWTKSQWEAMRLPVYDLAGARFHLTKVVELPHGNRSDVFGALRPRLSELVLALRLAHDGNVAAPIAAYLPPLDQPEITQDSSSGWARLDDCQPSGGGDPYQLAEGDVETLREIIAEIDGARTAGRLSQVGTAIRRFNLSYERAYADDVLIDLVIALESCLLLDRTATEKVTALFAGRGAELLRKFRNPETTSKMLKQTYNARSRIVHAGKSLEVLYSVQHRPSSELKYWWDQDSTANPRRGPMGVLADVRSLTRDVIRDYLRRLSKAAGTEAIITDLDRAIETASAPIAPIE